MDEPKAPPIIGVTFEPQEEPQPVGSVEHRQSLHALQEIHGHMAKQTELLEHIRQGTRENNGWLLWFMLLAILVLVVGCPTLANLGP